MKKKRLLSFLGIIACLLLAVPVSGEDAWDREYITPDGTYEGTFPRVVFKMDSMNIRLMLCVRSSNDKTVSIDVKETLKSGEISYSDLDRTSYVYYKVWDGYNWGPKVPVLYYGSFNRAGIHDGLNPYICWDAVNEIPNFKNKKGKNKEGWMAISKPASGHYVDEFEFLNSVLSREYSMVEWGWNGIETMHSAAMGFMQHCLNYDTYDGDDAYNTDFYMSIKWAVPSELAGKKICVGIHRVRYRNALNFLFTIGNYEMIDEAVDLDRLPEFTRKVEPRDIQIYNSLSEGTYNGIKQVTLLCRTPDCKIYYTLDGSEPTTSSAEYKEPIVISNTTTLKYMGVYKNNVKGYVQTYKYTINPIEYVDLGLPSGTIWATKNVGANSPEDFGNYYAWGEVETKNRYTDDNYKWGKRNNSTKYQNDGRYELEVQDDAASMNWGAQWRMPSKAQFEELSSECDVKWTQLNGVDGYLFTSKKDASKSMFIPAASYIWSDHPHCVYLFTADVANMKTGYVWRYRADNGGAFSWSSTEFRAMGVPVRPVMDPGQSVSELVLISGTPNKTEYLPGESFDVSGLEVSYLPIESSAEKVTDRVTWSVEPAVIYCGCKSVTVTATYDDITSEPVEIPITTGALSVDLGLSVQWSSFNIGAIAFTDYGNYYTCDDIDMVGNIEKVLGSGWRLPTEAEVKELQDTTKCTWQWYPAGNNEYGGVAGFRVIGKSTNNFIFLPAAGCKSGSNIVGSGSVGNYWTSAKNGSDASYMCFDAYDQCFGTDRCSNGRVIRVVKK